MDVRRTVLVSILPLLLALGAFAQGKPLLVCFGDSITAGLGLASGESYPDALRRDLNKLGYPYQVVNLGTSGATTKDAVERLPEVLRMHPSVVIVEFGGNDGLRGLPLSVTAQNLDKVLATLLHAHIRVLLAGITLPPNYGPDYIHSFDEVFRKAAARTRVAFVPMIYKDLIHVPGTIQPDGIHPTAKGSEILARTLLPALEPLLRKRRPASR
ncbi:MAG TPA: arylesterase [Terracidiphilus sp.]|nr:arylesterase [Terracidiphilus sp.]